MVDDARSAVMRTWTLPLGVATLQGHSVYDVEDPCTGDVLTQVPDCSSEDVDRVVATAHAAQRDWALRTPRQRGTALRALATLMRDHSEELALLDAIDGGFPLPAMRDDVTWAADVLELMADAALNLSGRTIPLSANLHYTLQQPYGVVARIVPFNHPVFFAGSKIAAPLMAGNAVVLKAPDQTPLSAIRLAELAREVLPEGLFGVVTGHGATAGAALVAHPLVRRIGFIGSPGTGRHIQRLAAEHGVKYVTLELGGKNPMIVMPDADLEAAAKSAVVGMNFTTTAGQSCGSTSRLLLHEAIADEVIDLVVDQVAAIKVGDPLVDGTDMGPVIDQAQYSKSLRAIESGRAGGASVLTGGGRAQGVGSKGWYVAPTVLAGVAPQADVARDEIFGPVLSVLTVRDEAEAVEVANSVEFGLTAAVWTNDVSQAHRMAAGLDAGYVWINGSARHYWGLPFGGRKSSGVGSEESTEELLSYTQVKAVTVTLD
ncbi:MULTISPECIES: aldehyde dehydrogenase family protein [Mycobacteriaceae]|uniref:Aldehyde dehydrogenase family protein n=1 Tax=Mycolicibacterium parafortuitum TaxID=39692 RepID=A0ACC6MPF7_MYCPF|nr:MULTISPECIES: aldehyde dehydrogenase family protein [Mycobacteriaceae]MDZ5088775.1 aldehyde dehydrogenase family protein [Mycolicibacterium parafortuitum]BBA72496.1 aldehyde dehydrogenase [Mycobacterium sp. PO1]BBA72858.1 aldehyde dehydrogenase [Mycobacterium sp. PO2]GFM18679.1 aldehyde dehydrogenase [Mycobacterium sp. PO1]GFM22189.1 aldehyde dehydrogenase [Mycobacterium sp. PO2]